MIIITILHLLFHTPCPPPHHAVSITATLPQKPVPVAAAKVHPGPAK